MAIKKGLFIIPDTIVVIHFRKGKSNWGILQNPFPLLEQKQIWKWNVGLAMVYGNDFVVNELVAFDRRCAETT